MRLSEIGKIVDECWREIPKHFAGTRVMPFQIMPNHVHGIVQINEESAGSQHAAPRQKPRRTQPAPGSLSTIVRSFKSAATKQVREMGFSHSSIWQRSFHDRIIRDDISHFFVERYIELNPIMWELDSDNPKTRNIAIDALRNTLTQEYGLDGSALEKIIEYESGYRNLHRG